MPCTLHERVMPRWRLRWVMRRLHARAGLFPSASYYAFHDIDDDFASDVDSSAAYLTGNSAYWLFLIYTTRRFQRAAKQAMPKATRPGDECQPASARTRNARALAHRRISAADRKGTRIDATPLCGESGETLRASCRLPTSERAARRRIELIETLCTKTKI